MKQTTDLLSPLSSRLEWPPCVPAAPANRELISLRQAVSVRKRLPPRQDVSKLLNTVLFALTLLPIKIKD